MLPVIIGLGLLGAGGRYLYKKRKPSGLTPERKKVYEEALKSLQEPDKLRTLADAFDKEGLKDEAVMLRKRAQLRELPPEQKAARKQAFRDALKSDKPEVVEELAAAFLSQGATGNAMSLRKHAEALRKALASK